VAEQYLARPRCPWHRTFARDGSSSASRAGTI